MQPSHYFLTKRWWILQGGVQEEALHDWILVMEVLELDKKARRDLFLLAQSGHVGRSQGNQLLWHLLSTHANYPAYLDLSNLVTHKVYRANQEFDKPPSPTSRPGLVMVDLLPVPEQDGSEVESCRGA